MGDIETESVMKHVIQIQKIFKHVHSLHGKLKERGGTQPVIPNQTRWNSSKDCLFSFKKNRNIYVEIRSDLLRVNDKKTLPEAIGRKVDDINIFRSAEHLLDQMTKFSVALDRLQSDTCYLSAAVEIWKDLLNDEVGNKLTNNLYKYLKLNTASYKFLLIKSIQTILYLCVCSWTIPNYY